MNEVALSVINKAKKPVLLMQNGQTLGEIVLVVYDDSSESSKGLVTALELARKTDRELVVMVLDNETESLKDRDQTVDELMQRSDTRISVTFMKQTHIWAFMNFISRFPEGLLVIPKYQALVTQHPFEKFLNMIDRPILLAS